MANEAPRFYRLCVILLSFEWIVFGSMHFSHLDETMRQVPNFIADQELRKFVVVSTGMISVTTGVIILVPQLRKYAALFSIILLLSYIPSVYKILSDESALVGSLFYKSFLKSIIVPNNIFLFLCSVHLWLNPRLHNDSAAKLIEKSLPLFSIPGPRYTALLVTVLLFLSNCVGLITILAAGYGNSAVAILWSLMLLATGALVGFLFAVPRVNKDFQSKSALTTNANIEAISDWLTKIIVGVGLIHAKDIGDSIAKLSEILTKSAKLAKGSPTSEYQAFATALIVYFFVLGIIQGYLFTRMYLSTQFNFLAHAMNEQENTKE